jgi:hypothetical protein
MEACCNAGSWMAEEMAGYELEASLEDNRVAGWDEDIPG